MATRWCSFTSKFAIEAFSSFAYSSVEKRVDNQIILQPRVPVPLQVQVYENFNVLTQPMK